MPELPEVRTVARTLDRLLKGKAIEGIEIYREKNVLDGKDHFVSLLFGKRFLSVDSHGKHLVFHLSEGTALLAHLRMEGKYFLRDEGEERGKHDILLFHLAGGKALVYQDVRKFGTLEARKEEELWDRPPLSLLGPEPWDADPGEIYRKMHRSKKPVKELLMDQRILAGIGNIYADESLFEAKVHPLRPGLTITEEETNLLLKAASSIMKEAIERGGSTIKSYHPEKGVDGRMQLFLKAYGHGNEPCPRCGFPLRRLEVGGRGTTFCPLCQKDPGKPLLIGVTGTIASGKSTFSHHLEEKGYTRISADEIVRDLYENPSIIKQIGRIAGVNAVEGGRIRKDVLLRKMGEDPRIRGRVEKLVHPRVFKEILSRVKKIPHEGKAVVEVPLLLGSPIEETMDLIVFVHAKEEMVRERLLARGKDPREALKVSPRFDKGEVRRKCGLILDGSGPLSSFLEEIDGIPYL